MKCIRMMKTKKVLRMNDKAARVLVSYGKAEWVAKQVWREEGRKYKSVCI